jgi:hypothetical protein
MEQAEQDRQNGTFRTGQVEQNIQEGTGRTRQTERTGRPGQERQPEQDKQKGTGYAAGTCSVDMQHGHEAWTCS